MWIAFPKKLPDMPKGNWKAGLKFGPKISSSDKPKKEKATAPPKGPSKKKEKPIPLDKPQEKSLQAFPKPPPKEKKKPKPLKRTPLKPPMKPIAQVWKKKRERIDNGGSETEVFKTIWNERLHCCQKCWIIMEWALEAFRWIDDAKGEKVQRLIRPECFAHLLAKKMYPEHRLDPRNIRLVCSKTCHKLTDEEYNDLEKRRLLDEELSNS